MKPGDVFRMGTRVFEVASDGVCSVSFPMSSISSIRCNYIADCTTEKSSIAALRLLSGESERGLRHAWSDKNDRRIELIERGLAAVLSPDDETELQQLQDWIDGQFRWSDRQLLAMLPPEVGLR